MTIGHNMSAVKRAKHISVASKRGRKWLARPVDIDAWVNASKKEELAPSGEWIEVDR